MSTVIATLTDKENRVRATLDQEGVWRAQEASLALQLDASYSPRLEAYAGPGAGPYGTAAALAAGRFLKLTVQFSESSNSESDGVIH